jgi:hypothetical protein
MLLKGDCDANCQRTNAPSGAATGGGAVIITASVGLGGVNRPDDVKKIQELLNDVRPEKGGPTPKLVVDGMCGPLTRAAIRNFQIRQQLAVKDSRVDPAGPTLQQLNAQRTNKPADPNRKIRETQRLAMAESAMPEAKEAVRRAIQTLDSALHYTMFGAGLTQSPDAFNFVSKHFKFDGVSETRTLSDLQFIRTIFFRMQAILRDHQGVTGNVAFGINLHDVDPFPEKTPPLWKAFVPGSDDSVYHTDRIYWTPKIDGHPRDRYLYLILHELAHFVDGNDPSVQILDHGYLALGTVFALKHHDCMRNADNYSIMAFDRAFGRARLTAIYPTAAMLPG